LIELITGLPGNAKTLYTIGHVMRRAEAEGRPVYYAGIKELKLDWTPIDPMKWMECPAGSIIVIDEAQKIFRNRSLGTQPGPHVTELEEHRHRGIDMYLITQHPSLIDPAVRRLSGVHRHMIRIFGMEASTVHKWSAVVDTPDKSHCRKDSEKERWAFDKSLYGLYKSAEVHTMKRSIPWKVWVVLAAPVALGLAGWWVYSSTVGKHKKPEQGAPAHARSAQQSGPAGRPRGSAGNQSATDGARAPDPLEDAKQYVYMNTPRVVGLQHTAPKYDELTKPVRVPVPAACIQFRGKCNCLTQQGTPMDVKESMCIEFARNGFFEEFDPEGDRKDVERGIASSRMLDERKHGGGDQHESRGSQVVVFDKVPDDVPKVQNSSAKKSG
jgi:zona occludens toxin